MVCEKLIMGKWKFLVRSKKQPILQIQLRSALVLFQKIVISMGLCLGLSVQKNVVMASLKRLFSSGIINPKIESKNCEKYIHDFRIATSSSAKAVRFLSGGNQQKVVLAKWLCSQSKIFIFDEPTRGNDVKAKSEIYELMNALTKEGAGILMISSELPEIMLMSDRVYVMREGQIVSELVGSQIKEDEILRFMLGGK